jgi:hypothetical protein
MEEDRPVHTDTSLVSEADLTTQDSTPSQSVTQALVEPIRVIAVKVGDRVRITDGMIAGFVNMFEVVAIDADGIALITPPISHKFAIDAVRLERIE